MNRSKLFEISPQKKQTFENGFSTSALAGQHKHRWNCVHRALHLVKSPYRIYEYTLHNEMEFLYLVCVEIAHILKRLLLLLLLVRTLFHSFIRVLLFFRCFTLKMFIYYKCMVTA